MPDVHTSPAETFSNAYLYISDFDMTMFDTFEPAPSGIGVNEAYKLAIEKVFSEDRQAVQKYEAQGEHDNRTPLEITAALLPKAPPPAIKKAAKALVEAKLDCLLDNIGQAMPDGQSWPRPLPGFVEAWHDMTALRDAGHDLSTAVISAGHEDFIMQSFQNYDLAMPDYMVTNETVAGLYSALPPHKLAKPSLIPVDIIRAQWFSSYAETEADKQALLSTSPDERILYAGDDDKKDRQMAENAGVRFVLIEKNTAEQCYRTVRSIVSLGVIAVAGAGNGHN